MVNEKLSYRDFPVARVDAWTPQFPAGRLDKIYLHWSGHDYYSVFTAYNFCVALDEHDEPIVAYTHDLLENMRDVRPDPFGPYAAHTKGRNSYACGIGVMCMEGATPADFGRYPLTEPLIDGMCLVVARVAAHYKIPIDADHVMTHAEAAVRDGYFGLEDGIDRWDIARLRPSSRPLVPEDAKMVGDQLRLRSLQFL